MSDQRPTSTKHSPPTTTPITSTSSFGPQSPTSLPSPQTAGTTNSTSRPATPSSARPATSNLAISTTTTSAAIGFTPQYQHHRRPSSTSLTSSRRTSLLTPPLDNLSLSSSPSGPQRLPRQPSSDFAELHNELEIEQEAAVNRLLNMIRLQQLQNQHLSSTQSDDGASSTGATFDSANSTRARSPGGASVRRSGLSRQSSFNQTTTAQNRPVSRASSTHTAGSPLLQPVSGGEDLVSGGILLGTSASRDETGFYMAETQMLSRENEMLKRRIRELERQVRELKAPGGVMEGSEESQVVEVSNEKAQAAQA
ncbi:hypothetical protein L211DRAFT_832790 [Terfezia boudieri ATCC MYA-4762]|uniref:Uncharacterized protein n=1 Tax=Terfezia boudieri ATCC MYA-4762 TaxID=1051890 RepID=A0A3N4M156_9PEZI|nr:hypothetical protein L211DRAFT_832790 [Terfezia boudieri ATCC MYA-4762]